MTSTQDKHAIGVFSSRNTAEQALKELRDTGFPMNKISVFTKSSDGDEELSSEDKSERTLTRSKGVRLGAAFGAAMGGLPVLVGGLGILFVPGVGPVLAAESILAALLTSGGVATVGGLLGALQGWFIPEEQAISYNDRVSQGDYLVTIEGTEDEIRRAEPVLSRWGIQEWRVFDNPTTLS